MSAEKHHPRPETELGRSRGAKALRQMLSSMGHEKIAKKNGYFNVTMPRESVATLKKKLQRPETSPLNRTATADE